MSSSIRRISSSTRRARRRSVAILGDAHVEAVEVVRNALVGGPEGSLRAEPTEEREVIPCGVVFRSVGYRGVALEGLPFEAGRGTIPNTGGRVLDEDGTPLAGVYCTGWIKRGPSGVIGTNKKDATETVELLLADAREGRLSPGEPVETLDALLEERGVEAVLYEGWAAIDAHERARGDEKGRPRVKLATWDELLAAAVRAGARAPE
jgi:ferredoxin--NADP+ reductase